MGIEAGELFRLRRRVTFGSVRLCAATLLLGLAWASDSRAVTPDSPEVRKLVDAGLAYLEKNTDSRFGGQCLVGLTFLKANRRDHARVRETLEACRAQIKANPSEGSLDMYSNGLAILFLCELSAEKHAREIERFLELMNKRQKPHGGWGYVGIPTGDTSQTQYAALSYWEANRHGFNLDAASVEKLVDWLMKTQDPYGCWGYQGEVSTTGAPIPQSETNCSMLAAGLGCVYICADLFDMRTNSTVREPETEAVSSIPAALRPVNESAAKNAPKKLRTNQVNAADLSGMMTRAHEWMEENYRIDIGPKVYYYLYGLERYKSFQEVHDRVIEEEPKWYNDGYKFLLENHQPDGGWRGYCGAECDTAFSVLFLLRSTQKSLRTRLGEGTLLGGRGLPSNLNRAKMRNGELIVDQVHTKVGALLSMIDDDNEGLLDELARDPTQLVVDKVDKQSARRLEQLVRGGEPEVRLLAVRALGRSGEMDYVPSLLYALTDPDRAIVLEARDGLQFISRNFDGFGPPDGFTEEQRFLAVDAWKKWYKSVRPTAILE